MGTKKIILNTSFDTAQQNMDFDEQLLTQQCGNERIERYYIWKKPGITTSFKQDCPDALRLMDHAKRLTGGGIVFHSPGDIVFSIISSKYDTEFPKKPSEKLNFVSKRIKTLLVQSDVTLDTMPSNGLKDINYCQYYPTPFELSVHGKKICGLTIRQYKTTWMIQGIIHASKSHKSFIPFLNKDSMLTIQIPLDVNLLKDLF
jgi:lipoate-protein ligase A